MRVTNLFLAATMAVLVFTGSQANGAIQEMVINGEFEIPDIGGGFSGEGDVNVPGWTSSVGTLELFSQGFAGSPVLGSDGLATGQHHELTFNLPSEFTTQAVTVPGPGPTGVLSFDAWPRSGSAVNVQVIGSLSGTLLDANHTPLAADAWTPFVSPTLNLMAGESITLRFQGTSGGGSGEHIDQVSFLVSTEPAIPEPASIAVFSLLILCAGTREWWRRRKL